LYHCRDLISVEKMPKRVCPSKPLWAVLILCGLTSVVALAVDTGCTQFITFYRVVAQRDAEPVFPIADLHTERGRTTTDFFHLIF
jgi:hypothetical protein